MAPRNQITGLEYIVVKIAQVDITNRIAHCTDKTGAPIQVVFRLAAGGILHVPAPDEKWSAKKLGHTWHLAEKQDTLPEHQWVVDNMQPGDTRISGETLHVLSEGFEFNGQPIGATTYSVFTADGSLTSFALAATPVDIHTIQAFIGGVLIDPRTIRLSGATVSFLTAPAAGTLVIYYQRSGFVFRDARVVRGHSVISGVEA